MMSQITQIRALMITQMRSMHTHPPKRVAGRRDANNADSEKRS